jgi:hypothetical protein
MNYIFYIHNEDYQGEIKKYFDFFCLYDVAKGLDWNLPLILSLLEDVLPDIIISLEHRVELMRPIEDTPTDLFILRERVKAIVGDNLSQIRFITDKNELPCDDSSSDSEYISIVSTEEEFFSCDELNIEKEDEEGYFSSLSKDLKELYLERKIEVSDPIHMKFNQILNNLIEYQNDRYAFSELLPIADRVKRFQAISSPDFLEFWKKKNGRCLGRGSPPLFYGVCIDPAWDDTDEDEDYPDLFG